jgi:hypothetical protein
MCVRRTVSLVVLVLVALLSGTACDSAQATDRTELIIDLADRLGRGDSLTYTATYQLPGGATATVVRAQRPTRLAIEYPGGKVILADARATTCRSARCTSVPAPTDGPATDLLRPATAAGLVPASTVADLLAAAALDPRMSFERRDTTIVGLHATCVRITGADGVPPLDTCVTSEGLLGSFAAILDGKELDLTLTGYRATADPTAFTIPRP